MSHKFDPQNLAKLDSPERRKMLPPEEVIDRAGFKAGDIVADIGSGIGYFAIPIARAVGNSGRVYGLDISDEMIAEAKSRAEQAGIKNIEFRKSGENQLPLLDSSVDVVFLANVIHEANEIELFTRELYRVIKPGGALIVVEWRKEPTPMGPPMEHRISVDEVKNLITGTGITYVSDHAVGMAHYLLKGKKG